MDSPRSPKPESAPGRRGATELPPDIAAGLSPEARRTAKRCLTVLGVLGAGSLVGVMSSLYLATHYPLLLIALSPIGRHLILVAPVVNPWAFVAVGVGRRTSFYLPCFFLGRALGPAALKWLDSQSPGLARFVRWLERLFVRAPHVVVFLLPGPAMSTIAGDSGMRSGVFVPILVAGLVARLLIVLWIGDWLRGPIEAVLAWIKEYWVPGTVVMVVGTLAYQRWQRARSS